MHVYVFFLLFAMAFVEFMLLGKQLLIFTNRNLLQLMHTKNIDINF